MSRSERKHDVTCVVNAHREGHLIYPTLKSVRRAADYAAKIGLSIQIMVVLDCADEDTLDIVQREASDSMLIKEVQFGDLAESRNFAVSQSKGRYTAFIDGDDLWGKSWLIDAWFIAENDEREVVLHPEYNLYFGSDDDHVFKHIDMDSPEFVLEYLYQNNYWTALSFARTSIYQRYPYTRNTIRDGFGYEDWTWNFETVSQGIVHKTVPSSCHFIRRGKDQPSLLDMSNNSRSVPRILDIYTQGRSAKPLQRIV